MSERWKYQIKSGVFSGLFMAIAMSLFDLTEMSFEEAFLSKRFIFKLLYWLLLGIFLNGYFNWRQKAKRENKQ